MDERLSETTDRERDTTGSGEPNEPRRVLLIHLDSGVLVLFGGELTRAGYLVTGTTDSRAGLRILQEADEPLIVLMGRTLPPPWLGFVPRSLVYFVTTVVDAILPHIGLSHLWRRILNDTGIVHRHAFVLITFDAHKLGRRTRRLLQHHHIEVLALPYDPRVLFDLVERAGHRISPR